MELRFTIVGRIVKSWMKWAGNMLIMKDERNYPRQKKSRKTTAEMGGLCEERAEKGGGGRTVERKGQQQGPMEKITKVAVQPCDN